MSNWLTKDRPTDDLLKCANCGWKPENMHMVAFVYNDSGVQQVTTCTVIPAEEPTAEEE